MLLKINGVVRLTRDVEIRYTQSGSAIASFGVASSKKYKTQSGEQKEETTFVDCTAFGRLAEICNQYLHKGSKIYIVGELKLDQWTAQDGTKRSKHSITIESMEMLDGNSGGNEATVKQNQQNNTDAQNATPQIPEIDIDDEIPF